jgi:gamma-glutamylputrescine oxidase
MISFWEKNSFTKYDFIIIGGGIVGLSSAISIKEKHPEASVLVLERGLFPSGASTKNAGFACFGSLTELLTDIKLIGEEAALQLVNERWEGLKMLRGRLGDQRIDYKCYGGYELINEETSGLKESAEKINDLLMPIFNKEVYKIGDYSAADFGFNQEVVREVIFNEFEAQIDTGKMMKNLYIFATSLGVEVLTGAEVEAIEDFNDKVQVKVVHSFLNTEVIFEASKLAVCTNAFASKFFPELKINPGRGLVLITKPIEDLKLKGVFHYDEGYFYFRNFNDRVIFGGGRNLDFETETSTEFEVNGKILAHLKNELKEVILPGQPHEIDMVWTGIMAFGPDKQPLLKKCSENIVLGVRLGGMGVAIGSRMGERISEILS